MSLTCARCDQNIELGEKVKMVRVDDNGRDNRIFTDDDMIIYHETCPT